MRLIISYRDSRVRKKIVGYKKQWIKLRKRKECNAMRFSRDQYLDLLTFRSAERQMFVELFGPLVGLEDEWKAQGALQEELDMTAFDWDYVDRASAGGNTGLLGGFEPKKLEETGEHIIERDSLGRTMKLIKKSATVPLPLDFPVKDMESWEKVKPFYTYSDERIDWEKVEEAKKLQKEGYLVIASIPGGYDLPRQLMGEEEACTSYYLKPELMKDILNTAKETSLRVLDTITKQLVIDQISVHEDLAGKSGPLVGPDQIREFIKPYFKAVWDLVSSRGTGLFQMDTDGNVNAVIESFLECGVNVIFPMEPAAGMDIVALRKQYGKKLGMLGGIDKHVLRKDKAAIKRELEYKMQPLMQEGGIVFGIDHRIPNGTPLENYRYYAQMGRELLGLPPLTQDSRGWKRMAF
jgi:uroporphyrinogen-III decarboxylase